MKPIKTPLKTPTIDQDSLIVVPINVEIIEPINEEEIQLKQEYSEWLEKEEYKHLAYSRY